jgi:hypothetical protein
MMVNVSQMAVSILGLAPLIIQILNHCLEYLLMLNPIAMMEYKQIVVPLIVYKLRVVRDYVHSRLLIVQKL